MNSLVIAINAVAPFLIYLSFGYLLIKSKCCDESFLHQLNKFVLAALFPFTMFYNTHDISISIGSCAKVVRACVLTLAFIIIVSFLVVTKVVGENAKKGVIIQALYRSYIVLYALPLAQNLFGDIGAELASIIVAIFVPIYNVVAIVVLEYFNKKDKVTFKLLIIKVLCNPLFQGAMLGIVFSLLKIKLPYSIEDTIKTIAGLTTPLVLIVLGGTTKLASIKEHLGYLLVTLGVKMILLPMIIVMIGRYIGLAKIELFIYFIVFATPIAVAHIPWLRIWVVMVS
ncbi:MAG: AEC family transporter [Erysipelotrichaceae bacterium]|nr:AEC family transporter [Erysipelotrichaceae bacterium]MDY5251481.1 AEC family transporter [Erysipelotrichaceae bacterium]